MFWPWNIALLNEILDCPDGHFEPKHPYIRQSNPINQLFVTSSETEWKMKT